MIEQINSYRKWQRRSTDEQYDGSTHFSVAVRLAMVAMLLSKGHTSWMFKSGAWWRIIIDHRSRFKGLYDDSIGTLTAGEYVSRYIRNEWIYPDSETVNAFNVSHFDITNWTSAPEKDE